MKCDINSAVQHAGVKGFPPLALRRSVFQPLHGANGGVAVASNEAKAAFRVAWERQRPLS